jgi:regulator of protease activity HflC (stomatin/prohibitin superfamily)
MKLPGKKTGILYDNGATSIIGLIIIGLLVYYAIQFWVITISVILLIYFTCGLKKIPTGHKGIILWFGARSQFVFNEGLAWHLPLFSTIEVVDCKVRFIDERNMTIALAYFINVNLKTSVSFKISSPFHYLNNYSITDLESKVKTYVTDNLRQYLTKNEVTEKEIISMDSTGYKRQQIELINDGYLKTLGIEITDIVIAIIEISQEMRTFFEVIRQADILHEKLPYKEALEKALLINNKISQTDFNLAINGLSQLRRLMALE